MTTDTEQHLEQSADREMWEFRPLPAKTRRRLRSLSSPKPEPKDDREWAVTRLPSKQEQKASLSEARKALQGTNKETNE